MEELNNRLGNIQEQLQALIVRYKEMEQENKLVWDEFRKLKEQYSKKAAEAKELEDKLKLMQIGSNINNGNSAKTAEAKRLINDYIKEIDNCISLLNN